MSGNDAGTLADLIADRPHLDVAADLTVTVDGHELQVESYTDRVFVDAPSIRAAVTGIRRLPDSGPGLFTIGRLLKAADLTVVVRVAGTEVARLGADRRGIKYGPLSIRPAGLLRVFVS